MRLTKRQLKRIIREEYSRLKRRGLLKESMGSPADAEAEAIITDFGLEVFGNLAKYLPDADSVEQLATGRGSYSAMLGEKEEEAAMIALKSLDSQNIPDPAQALFDALQTARSKPRQWR